MTSFSKGGTREQFVDVVGFGVDLSQPIPALLVGLGYVVHDLFLFVMKIPFYRALLYIK